MSFPFFFVRPFERRSGGHGRHRLHPDCRCCDPHRQPHQGRRFGSWGLENTHKAVFGKSRNIGGAQLVIHGGVQIIDHLSLVVEDAHAEVELNTRDCAIDSDVAQRTRV